MPIFISYARPDRPAVEVLAHDLQGTRESIWMDNELTGGQAWWDTILRQIRACDLYVLALSPESLRSRACRLELQYAVALRRPLLPVQIADLAISTAPQVVADTQIVDYRQRTPEAGFALWTAVMHRPPAPVLPDPLPPEPPPPRGRGARAIAVWAGPGSDATSGPTDSRPPSAAEPALACGLPAAAAP